MNLELKRRIFDATAWAVGVVVAAFLVTDAMAANRQMLSTASTAWQTECGSCHAAYPPRLLTAQSWRTIVKGLDRHFGVDASVDAPTAAVISAFLEAHAGREGSKRIDPSALRITDARWFRHEHGAITAAVWTRADVRRPANCGACHRDADRGDFSEHGVRLPR